jgi:hypothetical protein
LEKNILKGTQEVLSTVIELAISNLNPQGSGRGRVKFDWSAEVGSFEIVFHPNIYDHEAIDQSLRRHFVFGKGDILKRTFTFSLYPDPPYLSNEYVPLLADLLNFGCNGNREPLIVTRECLSWAMSMYLEKRNPKDSNRGRIEISWPERQPGMFVLNFFPRLGDPELKEPLLYSCFPLSEGNVLTKEVSFYPYGNPPYLQEDYPYRLAFIFRTMSYSVKGVPDDFID